MLGPAPKSSDMSQNGSIVVEILLENRKREANYSADRETMPHSRRRIKRVSQSPITSHHPQTEPEFNKSRNPATNMELLLLLASTDLRSL